MSETKTDEEMLRQYFPPPKNEAEKNDDINIVKFAKEYANQQNQELQRQLKAYEDIVTNDANTISNLIFENKELQRQLEWKETIKQEHIKNEARIVELLELGNLAADKITELQRQVEELKEEVSHKESLIAEFEVEQHNERKRYTQIKEAADEMLKVFCYEVNHSLTNTQDSQIRINQVIANYKHLTNKP